MRLESKRMGPDPGLNAMIQHRGRVSRVNVRLVVPVLQRHLMPSWNIYMEEGVLESCALVCGQGRILDRCFADEITVVPLDLVYIDSYRKVFFQEIGKQSLFRTR